MLTLMPVTAFGGLGTTEVNAATATGYGIVQDAKKYLGTPYKWGSSRYTTRTFDCSSFTQRVFKENGIPLPRGARDQSKRGYWVQKKNLRQGDLVFFSTGATDQYSGTRKIGHVGIYYGDGKVIHTWGTGGVRIQRMDSGWWSRHYVTARRIDYSYWNNR